MAASIPTLSAVTLTPAEIAAGFTANPTGTGFDVSFQLAGALLDLKAASIKLAVIISELPAGSNLSTVVAQLAILIATAASDLWDDTQIWNDTNIWVD